MVYRLAGQVYVMGVAPAHGNVFHAARVVNAATHHLVAVNRGVAVTPDRVANRFPEARVPGAAGPQSTAYVVHAHAAVPALPGCVLAAGPSAAG